MVRADHTGSRICCRRKESIQLQIPLQLPCYDLFEIMCWSVGTVHTDRCVALYMSVQPSPHMRVYVSVTSSQAHFLKLTGGVYKAKVHVHRCMLITDYLQFQLHGVELQTPIRTLDRFGDSRKLSLLLRAVRPIVARV